MKNFVSVKVNGVTKRIKTSDIIGFVCHCDKHNLKISVSCPKNALLIYKVIHFALGIAKAKKNLI